MAATGTIQMSKAEVLRPKTGALDTRMRCESEVARVRSAALLAPKNVGELRHRWREQPGGIPHRDIPHLPPLSNRSR